MALITAEQRTREVKDRRDFEESEARAKERRENELRKNLSVAERLMRRLETVSTKITFEDDLGEIPLEARLMTREERARAFDLNKRMMEFEGDLEKYQKVINDFVALAQEICLTSLDWNSPGVTDDVAVYFVLRAALGTIEAVGGSIQSFRKE